MPHNHTKLCENESDDYRGLVVVIGWLIKLPSLLRAHTTHTAIRIKTIEIQRIEALLFGRFFFGFNVYCALNGHLWCLTFPPERRELYAFRRMGDDRVIKNRVCSFDFSLLCLLACSIFFFISSDRVFFIMKTVCGQARHSAVDASGDRFFIPICFFLIPMLPHCGKCIRVYVFVCVSAVLCFAAHRRRRARRQKTHVVRGRTMRNHIDCIGPTHTHDTTVLHRPHVCWWYFFHRRSYVCVCVVYVRSTEKY